MFQFIPVSATSGSIRFMGTRSLKGFVVGYGLRDSWGRVNPHVALICDGVANAFSFRRPLLENGLGARYIRFESEFAR